MAVDNLEKLIISCGGFIVSGNKMYFDGRFERETECKKLSHGE